MILTAVLPWTPDRAVTSKMLGTLILSPHNATDSFTLDVGEMQTGIELRKNANRDVDIWKEIQEVN